MAHIDGIPLKKQFGQHFLRDQRVIDHMIEHVKLDESSSVFEIGCGDGFLTKSIVRQPFARLWIFEIDTDWVTYIRTAVKDPRVQVFEQNILDYAFAQFEQHKPWTLLANLPYQITFPLLHLLQKNRQFLKEGVIMIQEEVAEKIVKTSGRGYGFASVYFQHFFEWKKLDKVPPSAFLPPPKVFSRLLYFKPRASVVEIPDEENFWKFIKICFKQPRRTLKNNFAHTQFAQSPIAAATLALRAQQMNMADFLALWDQIR